MNESYIAKPWTFKIEFTRGCNLRCQFCPVFATPSLQDPGQRQFMHPKRLRKVARSLNQLNPKARIELTMRGEPTLNPWVKENVEILRQEIPLAQISMFSNGVRFLKEDPYLMGTLVEAGVNILCIDCYNGTYDRFQKIARLVKEMTESSGRSPVEIKDFREFSAYGRHTKGHELRVIVLVPDIGDKDEQGRPLVRVREIHNNAGNADPVSLEIKWGIKPLESPLTKKCARPFRELVVMVDGRVPICCHDWKAKCILGDLQSQTAEEIWYSDEHLDVLRSLYRKDRSGVPCNKCDYKGGYRLGLLQNPFEERR